MNNFITYCGIALLVGINIILLVMLKKAPSKSSQDNDVTFHLKASEYNHKQTVIHSLLNNDLQLSDSLEVTDINDTKVSLRSLVRNGSKIIVRNREEGCSLCIEHELQLIKKYADSIGIGNVIVITTHGNVRKMKVFVQTNKIPFSIYYCKKLNLPFEEISMKPFVFMLDPQLSTNNFFLPDVAATDISEAYYSTIFQTIFKHNKSSGSKANRNITIE